MLTDEHLYSSQLPRACFRTIKPRNVSYPLLATRRGARERCRNAGTNMALAYLSLPIPPWTTVAQSAPSTNAVPRLSLLT
ncbi:hypothetical protein ACU8KH_02327 [Lachancea thermotolerans]